MLQSGAYDVGLQPAICAGNTRWHERRWHERTMGGPTVAATPKKQETHLDDAQVASGGGLQYQQAARDPDQARAGITPAGVAPALDTADQGQNAEDFGGPAPDEEAILQEHGYPKTGRDLNARVTQVEHGPYAGGTEQGEPATTGQPADAVESDVRVAEDIDQPHPRTHQHAK